jgi:GNAT superfamily N-acetyltransferase
MIFVRFIVHSDMTDPPVTTVPLLFRPARQDDLPALVRMLADDPLGAQREVVSDPVDAAYAAAFAAIDTDPRNELIVAELDGAVAGTLQLTIIPCLTYRGRPRALIEGVRVDSSVRSHGIGAAMIEWAIERARSRNCVMVQLTTDRARDEALRFYERLGFVASHHGMKLHL